MWSVTRSRQRGISNKLELRLTLKDVVSFGQSVFMPEQHKPRPLKKIHAHNLLFKQSLKIAQSSRVSVLLTPGCHVPAPNFRVVQQLDG